MLSLEGDRILTRGMRSIHVWDASSYEKVGEIDFSDSSPPIEWWSLSPDGSLIAVIFPKEIQIVDWKARTILRHLRISESLTRNVMFSGDGSTLACVDSKSSVHIWDVPTGQKKDTLASPDYILPTEDAHSGYVTFVALSNSGKLVLTLVQNFDRISGGGYEWKWRLFDLKDESFKTFPNACWKFGVFSPDEKYFVESSGKIRYVEDGSMVRFGSPPHTLCFIPGSSEFDWHIDHQANESFWNGMGRSIGDPLNNYNIRYRTMSNDRLLFTGYFGRPPEVFKRNWPYPLWGQLTLQR